MYVCAYIDINIEVYIKIACWESIYTIIILFGFMLRCHLALQRDNRTHSGKKYLFFHSLANIIEFLDFCLSTSNTVFQSASCLHCKSAGCLFTCLNICLYLCSFFTTLLVLLIVGTLYIKNKSFKTRSMMKYVIINSLQFVYQYANL